ncbi:hypothetical protein Pve01_68030 [Planomonospora venezuelensis]|nr:hypothetical protein Pve01_68030 [Planomonospora venezuelensis]
MSSPSGPTSAGSTTTLTVRVYSSQPERRSDPGPGGKKDTMKHEYEATILFVHGATSGPG